MQRLWLTITITITFVIITIIIMMIAGKCLQRLWCRRHCPCCSTPEDDLLGSANLRTTSTGSTLLSRFQTTSSILILNTIIRSHSSSVVSGPSLYAPRHGDNAPRHGTQNASSQPQISAASIAAHR